MSNEERLNTHIELLKDRLMAAEMGLLNAFIAVDGLFIGAASIVSAVSPKIPKGFFVAIIACCSLSIILVLRNYAGIRSVFHDLLLSIYQALGQPAVPDPKAAKYVSQAQRADDIRQANARRERICYLLLAVTVVTFVYVLAAY